MNEYIALAAADELKLGQMKRVVVGGKRLLLCNSSGTLYCVDEMCSHEDYSLYLGCIKDGQTFGSICWNGCRNIWINRINRINRDDRC